jgi:predicted amidohydrolase YtcJ
LGSDAAEGRSSAVFAAADNGLYVVQPVLTPLRDQRVTPTEALKSMTIWAAKQYDEQARRDPLEPGKIADLEILDRNPLALDSIAINDIRVVATTK